MNTPVLMTRCRVLMLKHGHSCASGFYEIERSAVAAEHLDGRPFRKDRERRRCIGAEFLTCVHDFPADDGEHGFNGFNLLIGNREIITRKHGEISELA